MKVFNMESVKGSGREVANQFIIQHDGFRMFQSYNTPICELDMVNGKLTVYPDWDYGNTTRTYFAKFVNEQTPFRYESKQKWIKEMQNNDNIIEA